MQYEMYAAKTFFPQEAQKCSREHKTQSKQSWNYKYGVTKHNLKKKKKNNNETSLSQCLSNDFI